MMFTLNSPQPAVIDPAFVNVLPVSNSLSYQFYETGYLFKDTLGTGADALDSACCARYSVCCKIHGDVPDSKALLVPDDADVKCNLFHVRKASEPFHAADSAACFILFNHPSSNHTTKLAFEGAQRGPVCYFPGTRCN